MDAHVRGAVLPASSLGPFPFHPLALDEISYFFGIPCFGLQSLCSPSSWVRSNHSASTVENRIVDLSSFGSSALINSLIHFLLSVAPWSTGPLTTNR